MPILLQINTIINSGSHGKIAEAIGNMVMEQGWDSFIAYGRRPRASKSKLIKIGTKWDIGWHVLQTRLFDRHGLASRRATKNLIKRIKTIQPDIIHLHNIHGYYLNIEILFAYVSNANIPVVWTLHDCWSFTGHCSYFDFIKCEKWKSQCKACPQKEEYPSSFFIDRSEKNFLLKKELFSNLSNITLVPVSNWLKDILKESFLKNSPVKVIYNGINTDVFYPVASKAIRTKYNLHEKFIILGVASPWSLRKGLKDFIKLSEKLGLGYQIILVGLSSKQKNALPKNIIGIERTENFNELVQLYSVSDVFVNPTYEDNFPTTNLESLACGTPVVTYRTGGSPEAIDSSTGMVVDKGDMDGLINAIQQIHLKGKSFYSSACRARAVQLFSKEDRFKEYMDLYQELLHLHETNAIK